MDPLVRLIIVAWCAIALLLPGFLVSAEERDHAIVINDTSLTSDAGINENIVCTPSNMNLTHDFVLNMWKKSREAIGLGNIALEGEGNAKTKKETTTILNSFYHSDTSIVAYPPGVNHKNTVLYARIYKCANELVGRNLANVGTRDRTAAVNSTIVLDIRKLEKMRQERPYIGKSKIFAFVRDPLERFLSGFTEIVYRLFDDETVLAKRMAKAANTTFVEPKDGDNVIDLAYAKRFVRDIVDMKLPAGNTIKNHLHHIRPMSAEFFAFPVEIRGHLEHFREDWEMLIEPAYEFAPDFHFQHDLAAGAHPTSSNFPLFKSGEVTGKYDKHDPNNARSAMRELLKDEPHYKKSLCLLFLMDYVCLPEYKLPSECMYLREERLTMETVLRKANGF